MADEYDELGQLLTGETEEESTEFPGFIKHTSSDGSVYYTPSKTYKPPVAEPIPGTNLDNSEIPIPFVSLPDVPKDDVPAKKTAPVYEVTPDEPVPETPAEQLKKLEPPVDQPTVELDPWAAAADRVRRGVVRDRPKYEPEEPPPQEPDDRSFIDKATAPLRFGAEKAYEQLGAVYGIPAALAELLQGIEEKTPRENVPISARRTGGTATYPEEESIFKAPAEFLREKEKIFKSGIQQATGTEGQVPKTPLEKGAYWTGEYLMPAKGVTLPATIGLAAAGAAVRGGLTRFGPEDIPISTPAAAGDWPDPSKGTVFPGVKPQGKPVPVSPAPNAPKVPTPVPPGALVIPPTPAPAPAPAPGEPKKKAKISHAEAPVIPEGMFPGNIVPPPDQRITAPPNLKQRQGRLLKSGARSGAETDEQYAQRLENAWVLKEIQARMYSPSAMETFKGIGDMVQRMSGTELKAMGFAAGTLVGMALWGVVYKRFKKTELPNFRSVENAAPGTAAISTPTDLARAYDDINEPLTRIARRAGMDPTALNRVQQQLRINTRNGARSLADAAIAGRLETPSFKLIPKVSLEEMSRMSTPATDQYLKMRDLANQFAAKRKALGEIQQGKSISEGRIDGYTKAEVDQMIKDLEAANPGIDKIAEANQSWNASLREFLSNGEYGTLSKKEASELNAQRPNFLGGKIGDNAVAGQADDARRLIKQRLDNEAVGLYVDEMRKVDERLFTPITQKMLDDNPLWKDNVVRFMRNGKEEMYTTDRLLAGVLKTDYHMLTGAGANTLYATKRILESTTTGNLAPWFSVTSAMRSYWIAKFTTEQGFKAPTAVGSILAIPQQLIPQVAKSISHGLERGSGGMLDAVFGQGWTEGLSKRLATVYDESVYAQMKAAGSHRGSVLEQQLRSSMLDAADKKFAAAAADSNVVAAGQHFWNAWKATLEAIHNAPSFNFVKRNLGIEDNAALALRARRLTGDPRAGGVFRDVQGRPLQFESNNKFDQTVADTLVKGYGWTSEKAAQAIPWWNPTLQGAKRIGEAYLHDPIRFTRSVGMYAMAPTAAAFYWAKHLDLDENGNFRGDPNGKSYLDYLLNGRSAYNRQMNFYIPIPGRPVEDGAEITFFHELNPFKRGFEITLHHMLGSDAPKEGPLAFLMSMPDNKATGMTTRNELKKDLHTAAWAFLDTAIIPPMPPLVNVALGAFGIRGPQGAFGGDAFPVKRDPFNQNGGLPTALELMSRAAFGGNAEALGAFYAAATNSEGDTINALKNGFAQVRDVLVKKTPVLRDISGTLPDRSNNTDLAKDVFEHQQEFNDLSRFYKKWTVNQGKVNVQGASKPGQIAVQEQYGLQQLSPGNPGLDQPEPKNPLYNEFMDTFYRKFMKESPVMVKGQDEGGAAFKSLWRNYGTATQKLERLKDVNQGTYDRWQREMDDDARAELEKNGVDTTDRRAVVNFYRTMQYDALRVINYVRRATEYDMSQKASQQAGKPVQVRLKDLKPYDDPVTAMEKVFGMVPFQFPELLSE